MSFDPNQTDLDQQVRDAMNLFERAMVGDAPPVQPLRPARVLVALDGSQQDDAAMGVAQSFVSRFEASVSLIDAREDRSEPLEGLDQVRDEWQWLESQAEASYDQILDAVGNLHPDLLIVPCPFGRDFRAVGVDSVGTVIDVLMRRCPIPVIAIRDPDASWEKAINNVVLVVTSESESEPDAASWALGMVSPGGHVTMQIELQHEQFENVRDLLNSLEPKREIGEAELEQVVARSHQRLHGALSKGAREAKVNYRMHVPTPAEKEQAAIPAHVLTILPVEVDDAFAEGFASERLRKAYGPVMIVSSHVEQQS